MRNTKELISLKEHGVSTIPSNFNLPTYTKGAIDAIADLWNAGSNDINYNKTSVLIELVDKEIHRLYSKLKSDKFAKVTLETVSDYIESHE